MVEYRQAWNWQVSLAREIREGTRPNTLLLLEHPHVYTRGRLSQPEHLRVAEPELNKRGISVVDTDRGGQVTYHGPGQLVGYPIIDLKDWGGPLKYVRTLEQVIIQTLGDLGVEAGIVPGLTGVWVAQAKIAAIGVKISRGVAYHGFSLNVNPDLSYYDNIVPCGITDREVTSLERFLGRPVDLELVRHGLAYRFGRLMGFRMEEVLLEQPRFDADGEPPVGVAGAATLERKVAQDGLR